MTHKYIPETTHTIPATVRNVIGLLLISDSVIIVTTEDEELAIAEAVLRGAFPSKILNNTDPV